jgi:Predicted transcriptional regulator containing an HTH domain and an uncharacterized domain shared with the mammalian protein Schlafen
MTLQAKDTSKRTPRPRQRLSEQTRAFLSEGEGQHVDFKRTSEGISADDLVAFANTAGGGTILIGIDEELGADGVTRGTVRGCDVSDSTLLQILNKSVSCLPPIKITQHVENVSDKPIIRLSISESDGKPHCTSKGVYCVRDGRRNRPLHPSELLQMFLESEALTFAARFESTAERISDNLSKLEESLTGTIESMGQQLGWAEYKLGDTESTIDSILAHVRLLLEESQDESKRWRALFSQDGRADPIKERAKKEVLDALVAQLSGDPALLEKIKEGEGLSIQAKGKAAAELTEDDLRKVFSDALTVVEGKT